MPWIDRRFLEDLNDDLSHYKEVVSLIEKRFPKLLKPYMVEGVFKRGEHLSVDLLQREVDDIEAYEASQRGKQLIEENLLREGAPRATK